jgi:hypothetical protein
LENAQDIIKWLITIGGISILSFIGTIFGLIKSGVMLPKEIESADINNKKSEIDMYAKLEDAWANAIKKSVDWQSKFDGLSADFRVTKEKLDCVEKISKEQDEKIREQNNRILTLESLTELQKNEIIDLTKEVNNYSLWTNALVSQLERVNLKPIKMEEVAGVDSSVGKKDKKIK